MLQIKPALLLSKTEVFLFLAKRAFDPQQGVKRLFRPKKQQLDPKQQLIFVTKDEENTLLARLLRISPMMPDPNDGLSLNQYRLTPVFTRARSASGYLIRVIFCKQMLIGKPTDALFLF